MNDLNQVTPPTENYVGQAQPVLSPKHAKIPGIAVLAGLGAAVTILVIGLIILMAQNHGCSDPSQEKLNLPIAVMPGSCHMKLKPDAEKNNAVATGFGKLGGLRSSEFYVFATTEPKEKITSFYQQQLTSKSFRSDPVKPGNATGLKIDFSGVSMLLVTSYSDEQAAQLVEGHIKGKTVYSIVWDDGKFSDISGN